MIDRKTFFDSVRESIFRGSISQGQVEGTDTLLDMWESHYPDLPDAGMAYILASCYHESARTMQPVRETLASTDAAAIRILDRAWVKGQLKGVRAPYWRSGWFGRGLIQITLKDNYRKLTDWFKKSGIDIDLVANRDLALDPDVSARIAFEGIIHGLFRPGHWLAKYVTDSKQDFVGARNIVNGKFRTDDVDIARYAERFLKAIRAARVAYTPDPGLPAPTPPADAPEVDPYLSLVLRIEAELHKVPEGASKQFLREQLMLRAMQFTKVSGTMQPEIIVPAQVRSLPSPPTPDGNNIMQQIDGKKTYLVAIILAAIAISEGYLGVDIPGATMQDNWLEYVLAALGLGSMRHAIAKLFGVFLSRG
jgi:hypothetical protein